MMDPLEFCDDEDCEFCDPPKQPPAQDLGQTTFPPSGESDSDDETSASDDSPSIVHTWTKHADQAVKEPAEKLCAILVLWTRKIDTELQRFTILSGRLPTALYIARNTVVPSQAVRTLLTRLQTKSLAATQQRARPEQLAKLRPTLQGGFALALRRINSPRRIVAETTPETFLQLTSAEVPRTLGDLWPSASALRIEVQFKLTAFQRRTSILIAECLDTANPTNEVD